MDKQEIPIELELFWLNLQEVGFEETGDLVDLDYREHIEELVFEWDKRTSYWSDYLSIEVKGTNFYLAQRAATFMPFLRNQTMPEPIQDWICSMRSSMGYRGSRFVHALIEGSLYWKLWECYHLLPKPDITNPYEPIVEFFEWGGSVFHEHGTITTFRPARGMWMGSPPRHEYIIECQCDRIEWTRVDRRRFKKIEKMELKRQNQ